jgi:hypothetical protein
MPEPKREPRSFTSWLEDQRKGVLAIELADSLKELVAAVDAYGKPGTLTLKLTVKPSGRGSVGTVTVADTVTLKKPEGDRPEVFYFLDSDNNLCRANPAQESLLDSLREVPSPGELRSAE